ncbi:MAG: nucleotide pyrophosphohydrolase [Bradymonadaceae bacterium]
MSDESPSPSPGIGELQNRVDDWISQWEEGYWKPLSNLARLTEEVGELARLLNLRHGEKVEKSGDLAPGGSDDAVAEELGDILFVVIVIANSLDVDLERALEDVLQKYDVRDGDRWTAADDA